MTKCYTFYSYKGGSGRSTTAVNTVRHLIDALGANEEHPILIVDADLESAGLTYFFDCEDKFTSLFIDTIHTTRVLKEPSLLDGESGDQLFGVFDMDSQSAICEDRSLMEDLTEVFGNDYDLKTLFDGITLLSSEREIFKRIVRIYQQVQTEPLKVSGKKIHDRYRLIKLLSNMNRIHKDNTMSLSQKRTEKNKLLRGFLPAVGFVDVSSYFGIAEGTVKFLGTDVRFEGEQVLVGEDVVNVFRDLQLSCNEHGYSAIVFDSGAGVQSTAAALQEASHVLVYCMRPTGQFRKGTRNQLVEYREKLEETLQDNITDGEMPQNAKNVILLPTAVPMSLQNDEWSDEAFKAIRGIATSYYTIVDDTFCTKETALNEVEQFKWKECILVSKEQVSGKPDEEKAYCTYQKLANKLVELSVAPVEDD